MARQQSACVTRSGGGHGFQYPDNKVRVSYPTLYSFNTSSVSHTYPGGADYVSSVLSYVLWIGFILKFKVFYVHFFFFTLIPTNSTSLKLAKLLQTSNIY